MSNVNNSAEESSMTAPSTNVGFLEVGDLVLKKHRLHKIVGGRTSRLFAVPVSSLNFTGGKTLVSDIYRDLNNPLPPVEFEFHRLEQLIESSDVLLDLPLKSIEWNNKKNMTCLSSVK